MARYKPFDFGVEMGPVRSDSPGEPPIQGKGAVWVPSSPLDPGHWELDPDPGGWPADMGDNGGSGGGVGSTGGKTGWGGGYSGSSSKGWRGEIVIRPVLVDNYNDPPQKMDKEIDPGCNEHDRLQIELGFYELFYGEIAETLRQMHPQLWNCIVGMWNQMGYIACTGRNMEGADFELEAFSGQSQLQRQLEKNPCELDSGDIGYGNSGYVIYDRDTGLVWPNPAYPYLPTPEEWEGLRKRGRYRGKRVHFKVPSRNWLSDKLFDEIPVTAE